MSKLISGKEALIALVNGEQIEFNTGTGTWHEVHNGLTLHCFDAYEFRLKPRTITLNGIEVPACGENYQAGTYMFVLNSLEVDEYSKVILDANDEVPAYWWRTEEEVVQVVAALRSVFNGD